MPRLTWSCAARARVDGSAVAGGQAAAPDGRRRACSSWRWRRVGALRDELNEQLEIELVLDFSSSNRTLSEVRSARHDGEINPTQPEGGSSVDRPRAVIVSFVALLSLFGVAAVTFGEDTRDGSSTIATGIASVEHRPPDRYRRSRPEDVA